MFKLALAAAVLAATTLSPHAEPATSLLVAQKAPALPSSDANRNTKLADAAATTEDLIDSALNGKADNVAEKVAAMRKSLPTLRPLLSDGDVATLERQVSVMEQASAKGDILGTALVAVEAYRIIESATDTRRSPVPPDVAMMDYAGFKLSILATGPSHDWPAITETAKEAERTWAALARKIPDTSIRNLAGAIAVGLKDSVERKDVSGVKFAAKMQLEIVDVLEQYFKGAYRSPAR